MLGETSFPHLVHQNLRGSVCLSALPIKFKDKLPNLNKMLLEF